MIQFPNFIKKYESCHYRSTSSVLRDVYDGQIWKDFLYYDGQPFLALPYNFMLSLNVPIRRWAAATLLGSVDAKVSNDVKPSNFASVIRKRAINLKSMFIPTVEILNNFFQVRNNIRYNCRIQLGFSSSSKTISTISSSCSSYTKKLTWDILTITLELARPKMNWYFFDAQWGTGKSFGIANYVHIIRLTISLEKMPQTIVRSCPT